ncbi:hypothetical protein BDA99DRAFT_556464 [Phascolomyces articulosus]|uniref:Uncharacterized protein n=1 Tax=Phascolomyces articulosus TaxID=60185 RepID=A0AAD5K7H8_9FUNG|nr:hypothetical protein BDA99DRAFT_556464 [Phascolomyces articulosus]
MNHPQQTPRPFAEIWQWVTSLTETILESMDVYEEYHTLIEEYFDSDGPFPIESLNPPNNQLVLTKAGHHEFEHFLRRTKYELVMEHIM